MAPRWKRAARGDRTALGFVGRIDAIDGRCGGEPCHMGTRITVEATARLLRTVGDRRVLRMCPSLCPGDLDAARGCG